jgi:hypothetical protein
MRHGTPLDAIIYQIKYSIKDLPEVDSARSPNLGNRWKKIFYFVPLCLIEISGICFAIHEFDRSGGLGSQWLSWVCSQKYWYLVLPLGLLGFCTSLRAPRKIGHSPLASRVQASRRNASRIMRWTRSEIFRGTLKLLAPHHGPLNRSSFFFTHGFSVAAHARSR